MLAKFLIATSLSVAMVATAAPARPQDGGAGAAILPAADAADSGWGAAHSVTLPTDQQSDPFLEPTASSEFATDAARRMRPQWSLAAEWEPQVDGIELINWEARVTLATYPIGGPPPPLLSVGFSYTDLLAPAELDLPPSLYEFMLGASWMRRFHERWMMRFMINTALATDLNNTGDDAWQLRGGVFAMYDCRRDLQLIVGAVASGRADLPVLPGLGVLWRPNDSWHVNLMMPRPRVSYRLLDYGDRQHWVFVGGGLSGGTWAFASQGVDDEITYREWRAGIGWEYGPPKSFPPIPGGGLQFETELGYVFGRTFEFETRVGEIDVSDTIVLRSAVRF